MSAVSAVNGIQIEGTLSSLSALSTVYVPNPGISMITKNVHVYMNGMAQWKKGTSNILLVLRK